MTDLNNFNFIGRLVKDCEIKYTASGTCICSFSIAVNKQIDKENNYANFFECNLWGKLAQSLEPYLKKGQQIAVNGEIKQERWKDQQSGQNRSKIVFNVQNIQLIGGKNENSNR